MSDALFRFATAGSVDDGKSTLVGRLLHDSKAILADQLESVARTSAERGFGGEPGAIDFALLTDGLRAEREQGITIDVAYRYFSTGRRSFILADCPGHVQYTRNMVTGATTADAVVVLVDARNGVLEQTRRHLAVVAAAARAARDRRGEQDRPARLRRGGLHAGRRRGRRARRASSACPTRTSSRSRRSPATTSSSARRTRPGTTARACSSCSRRCRRSTSSRPSSRRCGCRCSSSSARRARWRTTSTTPSASATTARSPAASPRARCASATRCRCSPAVRRRRSTGIDAGAARARRGIRPAVGLAPARRRSSTPPAAPSSWRRARCPSRVASSTPRCSGSATRRCAPAPGCS